MNKYQKAISIIIILFAIIGCFILPWKADSWGLLKYFDLKNFGDLGSAIGGLTAPIIGIAGAILLYQTIKLQINIQKEQKEREGIVLLISLLKDSIDKFEYKNCRYNKRLNRNEPYGKLTHSATAIYNLLEQMYCNSEHIGVDIPALSAFESILQMTASLFTMLDKAKISSKYPLELMLVHQFSFRVFPRLKDEVDLNQRFCELCKRNHGLPGEYVLLLNSLKLRCSTYLYE